MATKITTNEYHVCPVCDSTKVTFGDIDTRKGTDGIFEWFQHITCNKCESTFISVFRHAYQEVIEDNSFNSKQETAKKMLLERIRTNTLTSTDLTLFSDMLDNAELVHGNGFQIGIYALTE